MSKGRKRIPDHLKVVRGTDRADRRNDEAPTPAQVPIVATSFKAVRKGDIYPSTIEKGEEVEGRLAKIAAALDALEKPERKTAPENKATKAAPANKATKAAPESKG